NVVTCARMKLNNLTFAVRDVSLFDEHNSYDLILCVESLQYIERPGVVLEKLAQALRPNGYLFIHMPLARYRPVPLHGFLRDFHNDEVVATRTKEDITAMAMSAKLTVEKVQDTFAYCTGELACSLFCMFYKDTLLNRILQSLISPWAKILGFLELRGRWSKGFAIALLAKKSA